MPRSADGQPALIDARGMRCPWPVLRAARAMRSNTQIILLSDDPIALKDVPEMARARGWQCLLTNSDDSMRFDIQSA